MRESVAGKDVNTKAEEPLSLKAVITMPSVEHLVRAVAKSKVCEFAIAL
jgi:hypothetical protein